MFALEEQLDTTEDYWDEALCRTGTGELAQVFFSEELHDIARAKNICAECPSMAACLEGALVRHEPWGVWGGQLFRNGKILATKRRRGRPPKQPRPEDQLPEVPIPVHLRDKARVVAARHRGPPVPTADGRTTPLPSGPPWTSPSRPPPLRRDATASRWRWPVPRPWPSSSRWWWGWC